MEGLSGNTNFFFTDYNKKFRQLKKKKTQTGIGPELGLGFLVYHHHHHQGLGF
jgi:hypothetical protein